MPRVCACAGACGTHRGIYREITRPFVKINAPINLDDSDFRYLRRTCRARERILEETGSPSEEPLALRDKSGSWIFIALINDRSCYGLNDRDHESTAAVFPGSTARSIPLLIQFPGWFKATPRTTRDEIAKLRTFWVHPRALCATFPWLRL